MNRWLMICMMLVAGSAGAQLTNATYTEEIAWTTALQASGESAGIYEVSPLGLPCNLTLSNEFAPDTFFIDGTDETVCTQVWPEGIAVTGGGLDDPITMTFGEKRNAVGVWYRGAVTIFVRSEVGGAVTATSFACGSASQPNLVGFCGLTTAEPFAVAEFADPYDGLVFVRDFLVSRRFLDPNVKACYTKDDKPATGVALTLTSGGGGLDELDENGCFSHPSVEGAGFFNITVGGPAP
jgi:hypothetical protein